MAASSSCCGGGDEEPGSDCGLGGDSGDFSKDNQAIVFIAWFSIIAGARFIWITSVPYRLITTTLTFIPARSFSTTRI
jgi:hypothetical protein